jgi:hypothetical protein
MYLDHPKITATNGDAEPDRLERLNRVYGYAIGLADQASNADCIVKISQIHDHKGTLIIVWNATPSAAEKEFFVKAWMSLIGDRTANVEHEVQQAA